MSDGLAEMLWTRKNDAPVLPFGALKEARCCACVQETFRRCAEEHPEWLTPKSGRFATRHIGRVTEYIERNTPPGPCLVIEYTVCDYCSEVEEVGVCPRHLRGRLDELDRMSE